MPVPRQPIGCVGAIIGAFFPLLAMYVLASGSGMGPGDPGDDNAIFEIALLVCCGLPVIIGAVSGYLLGRWLERLGGSEQQPDH